MAVAALVSIFDPTTLGALSLDNRVVMAPLTRTRADDDGVPTRLMVEYYAQRAGFGLIVSEGTWPVQESRSYPGQPGIETAEQVAAWREVTDAVHERGGRIVMQIMHGGRVSHTSISGTPRIVAPSAVAAPGQTRLPDGAKADMSRPDALTTDEAAQVVDVFVTAARNAMAAGFDGVEVHGANGYLLHQFLAPSSNLRDDRYGGSPQARARLVHEVVAAVAAEIGADRVGVRLSPERDVHGVVEDDPADVAATYAAVADGIRSLGLAYVHVLHPDPAGPLVQGLRRDVGAPFVANSGSATATSHEEAESLVGGGFADAVAVGRPAIANPDLVVRWEQGADLNDPRPELFYGRTAEGYTDYPSLDEVVVPA